MSEVFIEFLKTWLSNELIEIMVWDFEYHLLHATAQLFKNSFCMENGNLRSYFDLYWLFFCCNRVACILSSIFGPCSIFYKQIHKEKDIDIGYQCTVNNNALKTRYCEEKYIMNSYDKFWMILRQLQKEAKLQCL